MNKDYKPRPADETENGLGNYTKSDPLIKYPEIVVALSGVDGNAYSIIGVIKRALRSAGLSSTEVSLFCSEAMEGDYDHLLQTCMRWVTVRQMKTLVWENKSPKDIIDIITILITLGIEFSVKPKSSNAIDGWTITAINMDERLDLKGWGIE